jgi:hypothetical protein
MSIVQALIGSIVSNTSGGGGGGVFNGAPNPGSGNYQTTWPGSEGWGIQGMPYDPGSGISEIPNATWGWRRTTEQGIWSNGGNNNPGIFNAGNSPTYDNYGGFGSTSVSDNYCCEWKGYLRGQFTANFNFLIDSDDVAMFWIGNGALNPEGISPICTSNNSSGLATNSVSLTQGVWYPIRMRYQEWSGFERCQLYFQVANSPNPMYAMSQWQSEMGWNGGTSGY